MFLLFSATMLEPIQIRSSMASAHKSLGTYIHLGRTFLRISFLKKKCCDLNVGEGLCIFTSLLFPDSGLNLLNGFDFNFDLFWISVKLKTSISANSSCIFTKQEMVSKRAYLVSSRFVLCSKLKVWKFFFNKPNILGVFVGWCSLDLQGADVLVVLICKKVFAFPPLLWPLLCRCYVKKTYIGVYFPFFSPPSRSANPARLVNFFKQVFKGI